MKNTVWNQHLKKTWKSRRTGADKVPLKPQKVGFRARGSAIRQNPINLKKVDKSHPKGTQMALKFTKKRIKNLPGTNLKNRREKVI